MQENQELPIQMNDISKITNKQVSVVEREDNEMVVSTNQKTLNILNEINKLTLITPENLAKFQESQEFVLSTYTDVPQYRPLIVKLTSVLNDGQFPTPDSKFWQCKAEAEVHFNEMVRSLNKYKRALVDLKEIDYKIAQYESIKIENKENVDPVLVDFQIQRLQLKRENYEFELKQVEKNIKYRMEEVTDWASIADSLADKCEFSTNSHSDHYTKSFIKQLQIRLSKAENPDEKKKLSAQLITYNNLIKQKFDEITKKGG
jgi:hypothetical protein